MGRRMRRRQTSLTYLPACSVAVREDELLARRWGCKPASAHQRKLRLVRELVDVVEVKREIGALESLAVYVRPFEDAMGAGAAPDAEKREGMTDGAEDVAQALYRENPCEATARQLLRARAAERQASLDHDRAIAARHGITL